jgi:hypothetical protein
MKPTTLFLCLILGVALSGCDAATKGFNDSFDKEFRASCTKGAAEKGLPEAAAQKLCDCMMNDLSKHKKEGSLFIPSQEQLTAAGTKCAAQANLSAMTP